jgi:predicted O-methyltransferase YrrM
MNPYSTLSETGLLKWYASKAKKGIVEIGVLNGDTTRELADVAKVPIYGIDPFIPDSMDPGLIGNKEQVLEKMKGKDFTLFCDYSWNVARNFQQQFDMIFIDGDHQYTAVKRDVADWWSKLADGGMMFIHDSAPVVSVPSDFKGHEGPVRLVKELETNYKKIGTWDTITGFKKGPPDIRYTIGYAFHNRLDLVPRIIAGLAENIGDKARYIFILDGCSDILAKTVRSLSEKLGLVKFIEAPDVFELASNNLLLTAFCTDYLAIFQDDMVLKDPNLLENLNACVDRYPYSIGVIGCRSGFFAGYSDMSSSEFDKNENTKHILKPGETAVAWMVNRGPIVLSSELLKVIGRLDISYAKSGAYSEMDYCLRAAKVGFINVVMGADLEHARDFNKKLVPFDNAARDTFIKKWSEIRL